MSRDITTLLHAWRDGDATALEQLLPLVETALRRLARGYLRRERQGHTLQPTALVNEAFMRILDAKSLRWSDRSHFMSIAARLMRRVLVDHARARTSHKRAFDAGDAPLNEAVATSEATSLDVIAVDRALEALASVDPRQARVVELRFFGGLSVEETADVLHLSTETIKRDWRLAKVWLSRELGGGSA